MGRGFSLFFDAKDYEIRNVVNDFLERQKEDDRAHEAMRELRNTLHPHGIKELAISKELRIAEAVIALLGSLEMGKMQDRLDALQILHDEVLHAESSTFRHNTGRVLIQIMKQLIRARNDPDEQLRLAHDFRLAASGRRRIVRQMLDAYNILEMPEEWNQLTFDHHIHDASTKGRKTATHLIMDAWVKGIRKLTVIYYNFVEMRALEELLQSAEIMGISVQVGVEFQVHFRGRYVQLVWEPIGFNNTKEFLAFFEERAPRTLMEMGRRASQYHHEYVLRILMRYNESLRHEIGRAYGVELLPISEEEISSIVGAGQTSRVHLAELIYRRINNSFAERVPALQEAYLVAEDKDKAQIEMLMARVNSISPDALTEEWLSQDKIPDIPLPHFTGAQAHIPEIMRFLPSTLIGWLNSIRPSCNVVLNLNSLGPEDVLELLYTCDGMITHLEIFNLKNHSAGKMAAIPEISKLLTAINEGSSIALKRLIRGFIKGCDSCRRENEGDRVEIFADMLRNIPRFQGYYAVTPLKARIGSDSTSRYAKAYGMGFAYIETLPWRAKKSLRKQGQTSIVPLSQAVYPRTTLYPRPYQKLGLQFTRWLRRLPGLRTFAMERRREWIADPKSAKYAEKGNISLLGKPLTPDATQFSLTPKDRVRKKPPLMCMNSVLKNCLKVAVGFTITALTFQFTQTWWFLVWFGPIIWFGITGFRNIIQAWLGGGGLRGTPLLRWNDYLSWSRLCDSLLYTGFSVPLLELGMRWFLLDQVFELSPTEHPVIFYGIISLVNGLYISAHNMYRGLPTEAVIGNIFRSIIAIPVSVVYSMFFVQVFGFLGLDIILLQQGAAVVSKLASDSVAAVIEGFADKVEFLRMRKWDYSAKFKLLFNAFSELDLLLPDEDLIDHFRKTGTTAVSTDESVARLERIIIVCALDFQYFWMYLPRARDLLREQLASMTHDEVSIFMYSQALLRNVQGVSQLFVDGLVGANFAQPLSFYLAKYESYLEDMEKRTGLKPRTTENG